MFNITQGGQPRVACVTPHTHVHHLRGPAAFMLGGAQQPHSTSPRSTLPHTAAARPPQSAGCCSSSSSSTSCSPSTWTMCLPTKTVRLEPSCSVCLLLHVLAVEAQWLLDICWSTECRPQPPAPSADPALRLSPSLCPPLRQACARARPGTSSPPPTGRAGAAGGWAARTWSAPPGGLGGGCVWAQWRVLVGSPARHELR